MDIYRIEDSSASNEIEMLKFKSTVRQCIFYKEEVCTAPRIRFDACRTCYRIDPRAAMRSLFEKIKDLAAKLFNLRETKPEQFPPEWLFLVLPLIIHLG